MRGTGALWNGTALVICAIVLAPLAGLIGLSFDNTQTLWTHLLRTIIPHQVGVTVILLLGVASLTIFMGTLSAWLTTFYRFPGRRYMSWALLLPLALPSYIAAYSYGDLLDYAGPVFHIWCQFFPASAYPNFKSLGGAIFLLSFVLYPYVYISARASFLQQSTGLIENARILGLSPRQCLTRISLPLARPAILLGALMALMECLNDIGAVEYLGVQTLTIGIYNTWVSRGSLAGAAQLSLILLSFVIMFVIIEYALRGRGLFQSARLRNRKIKPFPLKPLQQALALVACSVPILFGFIIPVGQLLALSLKGTPLFSATASSTEALGSPDITHQGAASSFWEISDATLQAGLHSLSLAALAATVTTSVALFLAYRRRSAIPEGKDYLARISALGYAIPGTVLAIGLLAASGVISALSHGAVIIAGSLAGLILAYSIRFLSLAYGTLDDGFDRLPRAFDHAARILGRTRGGVFTSVHYALIRAPFFAAFILVFVDAMKELPATLILRPFGIETLATTVYTYASLEQIEQAAGPALMIIGFGLVPIIFILRMMENRG